MTPFDHFPAWIALIAALGVGRVLLSLLPPGRPGGHFVRDLPSTWAASHVLGLLALTAQARWCALVGLEAPAWAQLVPWLVIGVSRVLLLPGQVVPRHEPPEPQTAWPCWLAWAAVAAAVLVHGLGAGLEQASNLAATAVLVLEGARCLRCLPTLRAGVAVALAASLVATQAELGPEFGLAAAAAAGGVSWCRRADARGLALAAVALAGAGPVVGVAGGVMIVAISAGPARKRAAVAVVAALLLVLTPAVGANAGATLEASVPLLVSGAWVLGLVGPARDRELLWLVGLGLVLLLAPWDVAVGLQMLMPAGAVGLCARLRTESAA